jgi:hypothetical protein
MEKTDYQKNFNGLANKRSYENALSTGLDIKKGWLTSGLPDTRESHLRYEKLGFVDMKFEYAPGLKFPGDPDCPDLTEIDGCRCTIIYDVD